MAITNDQLREMVKHNEGYRPQLYLDSIGNLTGGYGHHFSIGSFLPDKACDVLFDHDIWSAKKDIQGFKRLTGVNGIGPVREAVLIDMLFNMGLPRVLNFKRMIKALRKADFVTASDEIKDSLYFKQHDKYDPGGPHRANRNAWMMREGVLFCGQECT